MELNNYQDAALKTAKYPKGLAGLMYVSLKLNGEAGEFAEHLGKAIRDDELFEIGEFDIARKTLLIKELGDVLWYVAAAANELGLKLETIAKLNLNKLADRQERGVIGGSGDNR